jgi:hypothetical protein
MLIPHRGTHIGVTSWYHDRRVAFTAQNTYKGLVGYHLFFNQFDTGEETTGFRLPSFPAYDIPMVFNDKVFDPRLSTTSLVADTLLPAPKACRIADDQHESQAVLTVPIQRGAANPRTADHYESNRTSGLL